MTLPVSKGKFNRVVGALLLFLYSFLVEMLLSRMEMDSCISIGFLALIIPSYIFLLYSALRDKNKIGFMFIFLLLTFFFYYGQYLLIVTGFRPELSKKYVSLICGRIENEFVIKAFFVLIRSVLMLYIGYSIRYKSTYFNGDDGDNSDRNKEINKENIEIPSGFATVALVLFVISAICEFIVLSYNISIGNYLKLREIDSDVYRFSSGNIMFYFGYLSKWFLPSSYMLLLNYAIRDEKKKYNFVVAVLFIYIFLYVQTGARFAILKVITGLFIIHNYYVHKFNRRDLRIIIPIGIVGMILFSILSDIRSYGVTLAGITAAIKNATPRYIFYDIFSESGATAISLANTLQYCPSRIPHKYFEFFLKTIANVLPGFINPFVDISMSTTSSYFSPLLYGYTGSGYGSSFITEAYFYWGNWLYLIIMIYGLIMGKIDKVLDKIKGITSITSIYITVFMFTEMIYWVRNDVFEIGRSYIYCVALPLLVISLLQTGKRRLR